MVLQNAAECQSDHVSPVCQCTLSHRDTSPAGVGFYRFGRRYNLRLCTGSYSLILSSQCCRGERWLRQPLPLQVHTAEGRRYPRGAAAERPVRHTCEHAVWDTASDRPRGLPFRRQSVVNAFRPSERSLAFEIVTQAFAAGLVYLHLNMYVFQEHACGCDFGRSSMLRLEALRESD